MKHIELVSAELLQQYGAQLITLAKGTFLFHHKEDATHFFLVHTGKIKMAHYSAEGREFVQGYFTDGQSFGEPPFFNETPYPASAVAETAATIWKVRREDFLRLLHDHFEVHLRLTKVLSERLVYKSMMLSEVAVEEADHRLTTLIRYFRKASGTPKNEPFTVPFTRQQLADLAGLRVETVIRTIKAMEEQGKLQITDRKIVWK